MLFPEAFPPFTRQNIPSCLLRFLTPSSHWKLFNEPELNMTFISGELFPSNEEYSLDGEGKPFISRLHRSKAQSRKTFRFRKSRIEQVKSPYAYDSNLSCPLTRV